MTRTEFLSKLLKYQSLQHASTNKTNSDGTWKNHKYLYIDKNGNYVYEDKTSKASSDNAKGAGDDYQRYLDEQKLKKASANQNGSAKQGEAAGKAQQKYQEQQKLKKQQGYQSGSAKQGETEGKAQQEYLANKKEEKIQYDKEHPYETAWYKIYLYEGDEWWKNYREALMDIPDFKDVVTRAKIYIDRNYKDILEKSKEEGTRPEIILPINASKFVETEIQEIIDNCNNIGINSAGQEFDAILREYVEDLMNGNAKVSNYNDTEKRDQAIKDSYISDKPNLKIINNLAKMQLSGEYTQEDVIKELSKIDKVNDYINKIKDDFKMHYENKLENEEKDKELFDDWGKYWENLDRNFENLEKTLIEKEPDLEGMPIKTILHNHVVRYYNDLYNPDSHDPYGLKNRDMEIRKSQDITQNSQKVNNNIKEDIKDNVKDLKDLLDVANTGFASPQQKKELSKDLDETLNEIKSKELKDEKTGLPIKAYDCTIEEDMGLVNYHRQLDQDDKDHWSKNCMMCTVAMVLRQRGYDVTAANRYDDGIYSTSLRNDCFIDLETSEGFETKNDLYNKIKEEPEGSYGDFSCDWNNCNWGHSMFYKIENGEMVIYDTQTNKKHTIEEIVDESHNWRITRMDDKEINDYAFIKYGWTKYY